MLKMEVIGHLGKDALVNQVNGKSVINFSVAHSEKYKNAVGEQQEKTIWVECAYWTDKTGIAPYLLKGTQVFAEGNPEARTYAKNDGSTGTSLTLRVQGVKLLGSANNNNSQTTQQAASNPAVSETTQTTTAAPGAKKLPF